MSAENTGPLHGVRVIDIAGPWFEMAGRVLADLGAEVIKIEPPQGAAGRKMLPFEAGREDQPDGSLYWAAMARGKRSIMLDIEQTAGCDALRALVATADILIESDNPGAMAKRGLGAAQLAALNPALIYVSITPFGQDGPMAQEPASQLSIEAAGGMISLIGDGDRPPISVGFPQAGYHAGVLAAMDAAIALNERHQSGMGQHLDVSAQAAMVLTTMNATGYPAMEGWEIPGYGMDRWMPVPQRTPGLDAPIILPCADGYVTNLMASFGPTIRALGEVIYWRIEAEGPLPAHLPAIDWNQWPAEVEAGRITMAQLNEAAQIAIKYLSTRTKKQILERTMSHGLLNVPISTARDLLEDEQLIARDFWQRINGRIHPAPFAKFSRSAIGGERGAPALGEGQALLQQPARLMAAPARRSGPRAQPLAGLRVADFAWVGVGPIITKALADQGATVVRIESAKRPDVLRLLAPFKRREAGINNSQFMANFNSSKYGMALDLAQEEARAVAKKIIGWADVLVESFTPGTIGRFGFDWESLSAERPDLIMLSTCLSGQTGPRRDLGGFGNSGAALAGLHAITGWPDRPPAGPYGAYTDFIAPRFGTLAIASAIYERNRSGKGQYIDLSQVETGLQFIEPLLLDYAVNSQVAGAVAHASLYECPHGVYRTGGIERYVAISVSDAAQWRALCKTAGLSQFSDARFDAVSVRFAVRDAIDAGLREFCAGKAPFALASQLRSAGVPASVVLRSSDLHEDAQLLHRGFFVTLEHKIMGQVPYDGMPTLYSETPGKLRKAAPVVGEDTDYVLREFLHLPDAEIDRLKAKGIFV